MVFTIYFGILTERSEKYKIIVVPESVDEFLNYIKMPVLVEDMHNLLIN